MTRLLVSVRDAAEAAEAMTAGADLVDVKEPRRGALGAADLRTVEQVIQAVAGRRPTSAALGELLDRQHGAAPDVPHGLDYAKFGLAGCAKLPNWVALWRRELERLPAKVNRVAVVYADRAAAAAPDPRAIVSHAVELGCRAVLLDTFQKTNGGLLQLWSLAEIEQFIDEVRAAGRLAVIGGSLNAHSIPQVLPLEPDYIAVRGAACSDGRTGKLDPAQVRYLARLVERGDTLLSARG